MKMVSSETEIPLSVVEKGELKPDQNEKFYTSLAKCGDKNMTIIDKSGLTIDNIFSMSPSICIIEKF